MSLPARARRFLAALPDGITSMVFLSAWIAPGLWHSTLVKNLVLTMLVEFLVIQANGFMMATLSNTNASRVSRVGAVLGVSLLYVAFIAAFCYAFEALWPLYLFGWLIASKILFALTDKGTGAEHAHQATLWGASAGFYIVGAIVTSTIPLPRLGLTEPGAAYGIIGSGQWVDSPQVAMAFGALYFGALAWLKSTLVVDRVPWRRVVRA